MRAQMQRLLDTNAEHGKDAERFAETAKAHANEQTVTVAFWSNSTEETDGDCVQLTMPVSYIIKAAEMWQHDSGLIRAAFQVVVNNVTGN